MAQILKNMSSYDMSGYTSYLSSISDRMEYYFLMIVIPTGLVGNLISIFIYSRPSLNKNTNTGLLYIWLCIINIVSLLYYAFVNRSGHLFKYKIYLPCGVDLFIRRNCNNSVSWIQVLITFDRFVAVIYPKKLFMRKKRVVYSIMVALLIFIIATNVPALITYPVVVSNSNSTNVQTICYVSDTMNIIVNISSIFLRVYIPFALMITLNFVVISRLTKSKKTINVSTTRNMPRGQTRNKEFRFKIAMVFIDFTFLAFYTPRAIALTFDIVDLITGSISADPLSDVIINTLFVNITQLLGLGYSTFMIIFFFVFNRIFRNELMKIVSLNYTFANSTEKLSSTRPTPIVP